MTGSTPPVPAGQSHLDLSQGRTSADPTPGPCPHREALAGADVRCRPRARDAPTDGDEVRRARTMAGDVRGARQHRAWRRSPPSAADPGPRRSGPEGPQSATGWRQCSFDGGPACIDRPGGHRPGGVDGPDLHARRCGERRRADLLRADPDRGPQVPIRPARSRPRSPRACSRARCARSATRPEARNRSGRGCCAWPCTSWWACSSPGSPSPRARLCAPCCVTVAIAGALRHALAVGEIHAHYQPIVNLVDGRVVGFEALCRWDSPRRGSTRPAQFIPMAERTGVIVPLGRLMLTAAAGQASRGTSRATTGWSSR